MKNKKQPFWKKLLIIIAILIVIVLVAVFLVWLVFTLSNRTNGRLVSSGEERRYVLYVPASYDPAVPSPLVISLHGYGEWPAHQQKLSGWNNLADEFGFLVVYPEGVDFPRRWRLYSDEQGAEPVDAVFIRDLINTLSQEYAIDPARIYANGLSNGGGMSDLLACTLSDQIAAVGGVSGAYLYPREQCQTSRPVPVIAFHGTADEVVPYWGGPSDAFDIDFPVVPAWAEWWAEHNLCQTASAVTGISGSVSGIQNTDCSSGADIIFYTIEGGGHTWPGGEPLPAWLVGETTYDIDATRVMWEFFQQHPME
jgi:polyhydroxybutyrate depolymerase